MNLNLTNRRPNFHRLSKRAIVLLAVHAVVFTAAYFVSFYIRHDFILDDDWLASFSATVVGVVLVKLAVFYALGLCHVSWGRVAFGDLTNLLWASTLAMLIFATVDSLLLSTGRVPWIPRVRRSVILLDWATTIFLLGGLRTLWRSVREELQPLFSGTAARRALVVGAGQSGELLARGLQATASNRYQVLGFLDDDPSLKHTRVGGIQVLGGLDDAAAVMAKRGVEEVIVPSGLLTGKQFRGLLAECKEAAAELKVLPGIDELLSGSKAPSHVQLRRVEIKDLLKRKPVELDDSAIRHLISGRVVMVTGAGGSIGSEKVTSMNSIDSLVNSGNAMSIMHRPGSHTSGS